MAVSEAQRRAAEKYLEKKDGVKVWVPKGDRQRYKEFAACHGYSLNGLIIGLMEEAMSGRIPLPPKKE